MNILPCSKIKTNPNKVCSKTFFFPHRIAFTIEAEKLTMRKYYQQRQLKEELRSSYITKLRRTVLQYALALLRIYQERAQTGTT